METILAKRVTRKHVIPPLRECLVWWKDISRQRVSWEHEDAYDKFMDWIKQFEVKVLIESWMEWVGENVAPFLLKRAPLEKNGCK